MSVKRVPQRLRATDGRTDLVLPDSIHRTERTAAPSKHAFKRAADGRCAWCGRPEKAHRVAS